MRRIVQSIWERKHLKLETPASCWLRERVQRRLRSRGEGFFFLKVFRLPRFAGKRGASRMLALPVLAPRQKKVEAADEDCLQLKGG